MLSLNPVFTPKEIQQNLIQGIEAFQKQREELSPDSATYQFNVQFELGTSLMLARLLLESNQIHLAEKYINSAKSLAITTKDSSKTHEVFQELLEKIEIIKSQKL